MSLFCPDCRQTYKDLTLRVCPRDGTRLYMLDSSDSDDPLVGATIDGRFQIEKSIGVGGMGTVYRARQLSVGRDVAVKVLRAELSGKEVALERFFREAKTISNLTHPNIVRLIDFGQDREFDVLFLAMELVDGVNLGDLLRKGRLRVALALEVTYQVCGALTEPHAAGVIHRDLKPDNLLLMPVSDGTVQTKVLDFGIARALETNDTTLTATGMICGTPAYMAPEQAQNDQLGPRTDLYALGVILYEMLSGWPPFSGTSSLQIMLKHIQEMPVALRELLPPATLPEEVEQFVYDLMHKDPAKRPTSARQVRDRIDQMRAEFDFGRVRIDETGDLEAFVMRKLPRGEEGSASGPTEALRRETNIEEMLTGHQSDAWQAPTTGGDTVDEMDHHTTFPFTADEDGDIKEDARVKISTKGGAQQAWTPGDQSAAPRPKNTDKNFVGEDVDAFGKTEAAKSPSESLEARPQTDPGVPRKTLVEDLENSSKVEETETAEKHRRSEVDRAGIRKPADTSDARIPVQTQGSGSNLSMPLILAAVMTVFIAALAVVVVMEIRSLNKPPEPTASAPTGAAAEPTPATPMDDGKSLPAGAKEGAIERGASLAGYVAATGRHVADDLEVGEAEVPATVRSAGKKSGSSKAGSANADSKKAGSTSAGPTKESGSSTKKTTNGNGGETSSGESDTTDFQKLLEERGLREPD